MPLYSLTDFREISRTLRLHVELYVLEKGERTYYRIQYFVLTMHCYRESIVSQCVFRRQINKSGICGDAQWKRDYRRTLLQLLALNTSPPNRLART